MDTISLWKAITPESDSYPSLQGSIQVDVVVIGAGITGVTTAYELVNQGKKVAIVEAGSVGLGTTGFSTGNLYVSTSPRYHVIQSRFGDEITNKVISSRQKAIDYIEKRVHAYHIDCDFLRRPAFYFVREESDVASLVEEADILKRGGIGIEECQTLEIDFPFKKAYKIQNQAKFNPLQYVVKMAAVLKEKGVQIFENSPALSIENHDNPQVVTAHGAVSCKQVVMATHVPKGMNLPQLLSPPYRSYAVGVRLKNNIYPNGRFVEWSEPRYTTSTHSIKPNQLDCLVVAGNHHRVGKPSDHIDNIKNLERYIEKHFDVDSIQYHWSAQHYQGADGLPYIGELSKNIYIATGFYADGLIYGTVAGQLLADLMTKRSNPYEAAYSTSRHSFFASSKTVVKESFNLLNEFMHDFPFNADVKHFKDIQRGEGKTIVIDGEKFGAYRDLNGKMQVVSAVCTHMKCIVKWNNLEKSWDCPCHGSRFTPEGVVIEGPAYHNLVKIKVEE